jgi:hypothetical protein
MMGCADKLSAIELWAAYRLMGVKPARAIERAKISKPNRYAQRLYDTAQVIRTERRYCKQNGIDFGSIERGFEDELKGIQAKIKLLKQDAANIRMRQRACAVVEYACLLRQGLVSDAGECCVSVLGQEFCEDSL